MVVDGHVADESIIRLISSNHVTYGLQETVVEGSAGIDWICYDGITS